MTFESLTNPNDLHFETDFSKEKIKLSFFLDGESDEEVSFKEIGEGRLKDIILSNSFLKNYVEDIDKVDLDKFWDALVVIQKMPEAGVDYQKIDKVNRGIVQRVLRKVGIVPIEKKGINAKHFLEYTLPLNSNKAAKYGKSMEKNGLTKINEAVLYSLHSYDELKNEYNKMVEDSKKGFKMGIIEII